MKSILAFSIILFLLVCGNPPADTQAQKIENLYLGLNKDAYLTGRYNSLDVLSEVKLEESAKDHYLRPDVKVALLKMINAFEESKPATYKQHIFLVSSFRSFNQQKSIWESKYTGKKVMREPIAGKTPDQIISLILEFSSAPGTSRHHWGTDFDLNALENGYFEGDGKGKILYDWLVTNAGSFGFCQPYNELAKRNGKGYQEEKWHWSYAPVSKRLQSEWVSAFKEKKIQMEGSFLGSEILGEKALTYVESTNSDCAKIAGGFTR
ncbi:D-alanyl-D-alanine carboxypeptidase family protein [Leptospira ognonensis]|uniref:D-alanyl-D-alanine carboxypeptidase family protein n=1 Tax=Leptospira ognonensis TaxID=2484945 RepID=A0A4R9K4K5_9LEPT|nr:M15 family metallopeptidase [Leptospira ognonensis]TGL60170.1 D-alanyl-D-alanine carboxypeptidase family protein [Leptospira ognonensis]